QNNHHRRDGGAKRYIDPEQCAYLVVADLSSLHGCQREAQILEHGHEVCNDYDHSHETVIIRRQQASKNCRSYYAEDKFQPMRDDSNGAASRSTSTYGRTEMFGGKVLRITRGFRHVGGMRGATFGRE